MAIKNNEAKTISEHIAELQWLVVAVLLLIIAIQGYAAITQLSITWDEPAYLFTGYAQLVTGDQSFGAFSNPPFIKYIIGIPLFFRDAQIATDGPTFKSGSDYAFGIETLYSMSREISGVVNWGRIMVLMLSLLLAIYVFLWSRQLFGVVAGVFALFLYAFEPNIIAHSTLATTDFGVSVFMFISAYYGWRFFKSRNAISAVLSGLLFGLALSSKTTAILLLPMFLIMASLYKFPDAPEVATGRPLNRWQGLLVIFALSFISLWATYGFQIQPLPGGNELIKGTDELSRVGREMFNKYNGISRGLPLPACSWFVTVIWQMAHTKVGHAAYLMGQYSAHGWWYYFIIAILIKTPVPLLASAAIGSYLMFRVLKDRRDRIVLLLIPVIIVGWSFFNKVDIGIRHILPLYPFMIVFGSQIAEYAFAPQRWQRFAVPVVSLWMVVSSLFIFPDYLAYFNELIGGPRQGHKYLVDSNLDWGQGLLQVKDFMQDNNLGAVKLVYFGSVNPLVYGVFAKPMSQQETLQPERDIYLISKTSLYDVYSKDHQAWQWARDLEPSDSVGESIFVYDLR